MVMLQSFYNIPQVILSAFCKYGMVENNNSYFEMYFGFKTFNYITMHSRSYAMNDARYISR